MSDPGYVYVLINRSMEGLVKIGKTERDPQERAKELSSVTSVPAPFIVAYKAFFNNCTQAEKFIHKKLEDKGYRVTNNREFFFAPLDEVIEFIIETQQILNSEKSTVSDITTEVYATESKDASLLDLAEYYYDIGKYRDAYKLYKQALEEGNQEAYYWLGRLTLEGEGCLKDEEEAIKFFQKGIESGDGRCYIELAKYYFNKVILYFHMDDDQFENYMNMMKEWFHKFLQSDVSCYTNYSKISNIFFFLLLLRESGTYIFDTIMYELKNDLVNYKEDLLKFFSDLQDYLFENNSEFIEFEAPILKYVIKSINNL